MLSVESEIAGWGIRNILKKGFFIFIVQGDNL